MPIRAEPQTLAICAADYHYNRKSIHELDEEMARILLYSSSVAVLSESIECLAFESNKSKVYQLVNGIF